MRIFVFVSDALMYGEGILAKTNQPEIARPMV